MCCLIDFDVDVDVNVDVSVNTDVVKTAKITTKNMRFDFYIETTTLLFK